MTTGSTDNPRPAIESFEDHRIHYISQMNAGGGTARNRAIDEAKGEFIAFLDSDDRFLPGHLESMQRIVQGRCDVAAYAQVIVDRHIGATFLKPLCAIREFESMAEYLCCERGFVQTSALVVPAALARKVRYREGMPFGQDTDFAIRLSVAGCKFVMARQPGAIWNDHLILIECPSYERAPVLFRG